MLKLIQTRECPPDQFRYKHKESGWSDKCFDYSGLLSRVETHRRINGFPPVSEAEIQDQLCRLLPPGWCVQDTGEPPQWYLDARIDVNDVLRGTKVLASFIGQGMPLVSREVAAARGAICAGCPFATSVAGCGPCVGLMDLISEFAGSQELPCDAQLSTKSCLVCKCAARAQIWLPAEILNHGVTDEMMDQFPEGWCWKRRELLPFRKPQP